MNPSHSHCAISAPNPSDALTQINPLGPNYAPWAHLDRQMADDADHQRREVVAATQIRGGNASLTRGDNDETYR